MEIIFSNIEVMRPSAFIFVSVSLISIGSNCSAVDDGDKFIGERNFRRYFFASVYIFSKLGHPKQDSLRVKSVVNSPADDDTNANLYVGIHFTGRLCGFVSYGKQQGR